MGFMAGDDDESKKFSEENMSLLQDYPAQRRRTGDLQEQASQAASRLTGGHRRDYMRACAAIPAL
jgi:hypothetical protein